MSQVTTREDPLLNALRLDISNYCKKLAFSQNPVRLCSSDATPKQEEFLHRVFMEEIEHRERMRKDRLFSKAAFPVRKTLEGYEFRQIRLPNALSKDELTSCQFVRDKRNLVLYEPVGTGKTHLAVALGVKACEMGLNVRYFTVAALVTHLSESKHMGSLEKILRDLDNADLVILDE